MSSPVEVAIRTQLFTLPAGGQTLNLMDDSMYILLKGKLIVSQSDDIQYAGSVDKQDSRKSFNFGPFLTSGQGGIGAGADYIFNSQNNAIFGRKASANPPS